MQIRVGLVGAGKMGLSHFAIINALPGSSVVAVCDTSMYVLSILRKYAGVETFGSYQEMMAAGGLDAVIVAVPNVDHFECAKLALEHDLHVFVEKPLTLNPKESRILADLAARRGLVNQVGFHNRFIGTFREARRVIAAGALGDVSAIHGSAFGQVVVKEQSATWRSQKSAGGGCLHDYACHVVDLMNFLVGPPSRVLSAHLQTVFSASVEDTVSAHFLYADGKCGILDANWSDETHRKMSTTITAYGNRGKLIVDRQELKLYLRAGSTFKDYQEGWNTRYITSLQEPVPFYLRGEEYSAQLASFLSAIKAGATEENSFASASESDLVLDMITKAHQANGPEMRR